MSQIKAIETHYGGYRFRSRLEARWAVFFDALKLPWEYEKEGYCLGNCGLYLPDFWLPTVGLRAHRDTGIWCEIKAVEPTQTESDRCEKLALLTHGSVILCVGLPQRLEGAYQFDFHEGVEGYCWWDNYMLFCKCLNPACGYVKVEFLECNYEYCPKCQEKASFEHPAISQAMEAATSARFEYTR